MDLATLGLDIDSGPATAPRLTKESSEDNRADRSTYLTDFDR